jgi:hypothetical protein
MKSLKKLDSKACEILVFLATGQRELAREILINSQNEFWLFESLLRECKIKKGIPYPSVTLLKAFPGKGKKLRATLAMLEILLQAPEWMKSEKKLYCVTDIESKLNNDNIDWFLELSNQFSNFYTLERKMTFLQQLEHLSVSTAKALSHHQGDLNLLNIKKLSVDAAECLSSHTGLLHFTGIDISRTPFAGFGWSTHYDYKYEKWPSSVFEALSKHRGGLSLHSLDALSDEDAKILSKHKGPLYLNRLFEISDNTAKVLAKHIGGTLELNGLSSLSDKASNFLQTHQGGLGLDRLSCLSEACAEALSKYQGSHLTLRGLDNLTEKGAELLSKYEGDLYFCGLKILEPMAAKFFGNHHGHLCFCNLKKITTAQAEGLCNHKGTLCLKGLTNVSKETALVLSKIEKAEFAGKVANKIIGLRHDI